MAGFCVVVLMMGVYIPILIIMLLLLCIFLIYLIFNYFLESFALYRMCKNSNRKHPICAWIPQYNRVILGEFAGNKRLGYILFSLDLILLIVSFFYCHYMTLSKEIITFLNYLSLGLSLTVYVINMVLVHSIMKKTIPKASDILTVLNVFTFGISNSIVLFILRNNKKLYVNEIE